MPIRDFTMDYKKGSHSDLFLMKLMNLSPDLTNSGSSSFSDNLSKLFILSAEFVGNGNTKHERCGK